MTEHKMYVSGSTAAMLIICVTEIIVTAIPASLEQYCACNRPKESVLYGLQAHG